MNEPPLNFRVLKINKEGGWEPGGGQVVDALREMLIRERLDAFQFDNQPTFNYQVGKIRADHLALVKHGMRSLSPYAPSAQYQFIEHRSLIHLLQEPTPQGVRNLVSGSHHVGNHFTFIHVY